MVKVPALEILVGEAIAVLALLVALFLALAFTAVVLFFFLRRLLGSLRRDDDIVVRVFFIVVVVVLACGFVLRAFGDFRVLLRRLTS